MELTTTTDPKDRSRDPETIRTIISAEASRITEAHALATNLGLPLPAFVLAHVATIRDRAPDIRHPAVGAWLRLAWCRKLGASLPLDSLLGDITDLVDLLMNGAGTSYAHSVTRELAAMRLLADAKLPSVPTCSWYAADLNSNVRRGLWRDGIPAADIAVMTAMAHSSPKLGPHLTALFADSPSILDLASAISAS